MKPRQDILVAGDDMGTSGTLIYNLDYSDPLTQLILSFDATNGATSNKNNPIEANISKIELVDGSEVLWSLRGTLAYSLYRGNVGGKGIERYSGAISDGQWVTIPIRFGRKRYDSDLAFHPKAFRNPQLKVTFDEATIRAAGATGFVSDSFALTIMADLMEEAAAPVGFLSAEEVYAYTSLASGDTVVDMPRDHKYRQMLLRAYEDNVWWGTDISRVKLNCNGGKFFPFDLTSGQFEYAAVQDYPLCDREIYTVADNAEAHQGWMGLGEVYGCYHHSGAYIVGVSSYAGNRFTFRIFNNAGVAAAAQPVHASIRGRFPHTTIPYMFGTPENLDSWFNAPEYNSVKLYLTNAGAGADVQVAVEQLRMY